MLSLLLLSTPSALAAEATDARWHYAGPSGVDEGEQDLAAIVASIRANPDAKHFIWQPGWPDWKPWDAVSEIKAGVEGVSASAPSMTWSYTAGGAPESLSAAEIAGRVRDNPDARHLVWQSGWTDWKPAGEVPELASSPPPVAPAAVAAPPPVMPEPPPKTSLFLPPPEHLRLRVKVAGELRAGGGMIDYVALPALDTDPAPPGFGFAIDRARVTAEAELGDHMTSRVTVDATGWAAPEAWLQTGFDTGNADHHLRVGAQETVLGTRDYYDGYDAYYLGGVAAGSLAQRFGVQNPETIAAAWHSGVEDTFAFDVQVANGGSPVASAGSRVDLVGRVSARPVKFLGAWVSGLYGTRVAEEENATFALVDGALELRGGPFRLLAEGMYGSTTGSDFVYPTGGILGAVAVDAGLKGERLDHLAIVGRYGLYDPIIGAGVDVVASAAAAANLFWDAGPERTAMTGLAWELWFPQDETQPVTMDLTLQVAAQF